VGTRAGFAASLRQWARFATALLVLLVAAPVALGGAAGPLARALGAQEEHLCKCGMEPGKCGCPECARLERDRLHDAAPDLVSTLKKPCDQDRAAIAFDALPAGVLASAGTKLAIPRGERIRVGAHLSRLDPRDTEPPTPPPRLATT
jgi:hypothetical protein